MNLILATDAYKHTHWKQYPEGTCRVYSYLESRGGRFRGTMMFGLQYYIDKFLKGTAILSHHIAEAKEFHKGLFGHTNYFNEQGWQHILEVHHGRLPIEIRAVPEGIVVPTRNVLCTIVNTDPYVPWLTNFVETMMLRVWYPITVATVSWQIKQLIAKYAKQTAGEVGPFSLNDFGYRGVSSEESAAIGGAAHLVNFSGTDTLAGILMAQKFYDAQPGVGMSVMASEHSTTTIYGRDGEFGAYIKFIEAAGPGQIVSLVADSWNYYETLRAFTDRDDLRGAVRKLGASGGRTVIRPDSGHPPAVMVQTLSILERGYQISTTPKGFKLLPPEIGVIYGDWMSYEMIDQVCRAMLEAGWAVDPRNVVFGMGGGLLQQVNRDTQKFAWKCSAAEMVDPDGKGGINWIDVYKQPFTDQSKASKRGRMKLIAVDGASGRSYSTVPLQHPSEDVLQLVFRDGEMFNVQRFSEIRDRANQPSPECVGIHDPARE